MVNATAASVGHSLDGNLQCEPYQGLSSHALLSQSIVIQGKQGGAVLAEKLSAFAHRIYTLPFFALFCSWRERGEDIGQTATVDLCETEYDQV